MAIAVPDGVSEDPRGRSRQGVSQHWGTGTYYYRIVNCPKARVHTLMQAGEALAYGSIIPEAWLGHPPTEDAAAPRLQSVDVSQKKQGGGDQFKLGYLEVDAGTAANGYAECSTDGQRSEGQYGTDLVTHGVALTTTSTGNPTVGKTSSGSNPTAATHSVCVDVQCDETSHKGRVLVTARWRAADAGSFSQRV